MKKQKYLNRELSWLEFNQRVLDEAQDPGVLLLERIKFLAITASNLDEFFMVRVGGLQMLVEDGHRKKDPAGMTPLQQLRAISERVTRMVEDQYSCFGDQLEPGLAEEGIRRLRLAELSPHQDAYVQEFFGSEVYPVVTPMALEPGPQAPLLVNRGTYVLALVRPPPEVPGHEQRFVALPLGEALSRVVTLPSDHGYHYILLEDVIIGSIERFFPGEHVREASAFRLTRNADISLREDQAADLMIEMEEVLTARKRSECARLELCVGVSRTIRGFLRRYLGVDDRDIHVVNGPLDLSAFLAVADVSGFDNLREKPWPPQPSADIDPAMSMFQNIARRDILLYHPQQSFDPVVRFVREAASDPDVLAIKQVLYRTSKQSPIITALAAAAEAGKSVTAIVELKARFDEERNIEWARALEETGVQVIYGIKGLKTHAKICIVVRREPEGIRRYVHFGTGNYNDVTARLYTDLSYMTANAELGADASTFFNTITGYSQPQRYMHLEAAPLGLRERILEHIRGETQRAKQGDKAVITAKMNSLVDPAIIDALYEASCAGVKVRLNIRGICCLRPGVKGLSENIDVISIVDRFLEHDRIFLFRYGGTDRVFLSSADWMPRNLDRRIELLVPVIDPACKEQLIRVLKERFKDVVKAKRLLADGSYERVEPSKRQARVRSQESIYELARRAVRSAKDAKPTVFEPHRNPRPRSSISD